MYFSLLLNAMIRDQGNYYKQIFLHPFSQQTLHLIIFILDRSRQKKQPSLQPTRYIYLSPIIFTFWKVRKNYWTYIFSKKWLYDLVDWFIVWLIDYLIV